LAHSSRTWRGARTPSALKRVRQSAHRHTINGPRISETKTLASKAIRLATAGLAEAAGEAVREAVSALDKAAKVGAIHDNAADRRKSRLMLKVNETLGGAAAAAPAARPARATGKAAAAKEARARIAASKAVKAKGEQTAAGKARAALSRSTREAAAPTPEPTEAPPGTTAKAKAPARTSRTRASASVGSSAAPKPRRTTKTAASSDKAAAPKPRTAKPKPKS
jgi:small subunit ribosomal protein S20